MIKIKIRRLYRKTKRNFWRAFFCPIPRTSPFTFLITKLFPSTQFFKKTVALTTVFIYFTTQIAFAQNVMMAMPKNALPNFFHDLKIKINLYWTAGRIVFHALPGYDKLREDRDRSGYMSPERLMEREKQQLERIETPQQLLKDRGLQMPKGQEQYNGKEKMTAEQFWQNLETMKGIQGDIAKVRQQSKQDVAAGTEANYILYNDGKQVFFKDGLTTRILNERVLDARGNLTLRNTYQMQYNNKRLMTSYIADETDPQGNITTTRRKDITYTDDSVYYAGKDTVAKQQITSFEENRVDPLGNASTIFRKNMKYDDESRITHFDEEQIDTFGNHSNKIWTNAKYDTNDNLMSYDENTIDSFGNKSSKHWGDAKYIINSQWNGVSDRVHNKYLLEEYTQTVTDPSGAVSKERWHDVQYNEYNELVSHTTTRTDFLGFVTETKVSDSKYNQYGQMISFDQTIEDEDRADKKKKNIQLMQRRDVRYTKIGDTLSYNEIIIDNQGRKLERTRTNIVYNDKRLQIGYFELETLPDMTQIGKTWSVAEKEGDKIKGYKEVKGKVGYFKQEALPVPAPIQTQIIKDWSAYGKNEGYNERGQLIGYREISGIYRKGIKEGERDIEIKKYVSDITYDKSGKQSGSIEDTSTLGKNEDGKNIDGRLLVTTTRLSTQDDSDGKIVGYKERVDTKGWDGEGNLKRDLSVEKIKDSITLTSYNETVHTTSQDGVAKLDSISTTERKDMVLDGFGRLASYKENITSSTYDPVSKRVWLNPELEVHRELSTISYDLQNQLVGSIEVSTDKKGAKTTTILRNSLYNSLGQATSFSRETTQEYKDESFQTVLDRSKIYYNFLSDMTNYHDRTTKPGSKKAEETDWEARGYNLMGQLDGYQQKYLENGLNVEMNVSGMKYDLIGRSLGQETETIKTGREKRFSYTQMVDGKEKRLSPVELSLLLEKRAEDLEKEAAKIAEEKGEKVQGLLIPVGEKRADVLLKRLVEEGVIQKKWEDKEVNEKVSSLRYGMLYNDLNQAIEYMDQVTSADGSINTNRMSGMEYDPLGRVSGFLNTQESFIGKMIVHVLNAKSLYSTGNEKLVQALEKLRDELEKIDQNDSKKWTQSEIDLLAALDLALEGRKDIVVLDGRIAKALVSEGGKNFYDLFSGDLKIIQAKEVDVHSLEKSFTRRLGVSYTPQTNNVAGYTEVSWDESMGKATGIKLTTSKVQNSYNDFEQIQTSAVESETIRTNGSVEKSSLVTTNEYEVPGGKMVGATAVTPEGKPNTSTDSVYNDSNMDGVIDDVEKANPVSSISESFSTVGMIYGVINGLPKIFAQGNYSNTTYLNGNNTESTQNLFYENDDQTGKLLSASGITFTSSRSAYTLINPDGTTSVVKGKNSSVVSSSITRQIYAPYGNQSKLALTLTNSLTPAPDGPLTKTISSTAYLYNNDGRLISATGSGSSISFNGYVKDAQGNYIKDSQGNLVPNDPTFGSFIQRYQIIRDQAALEAQENESKSMHYDEESNEWVEGNKDGTFSSQITRQRYLNDDEGRLLGVVGDMGLDDHPELNFFGPEDLDIQAFKKILSSNREAELMIRKVLQDKFGVSIEQFLALGNDEAVEVLRAAFNFLLTVPDFYRQVNIQSLNLSPEMAERYEKIKELVEKGELEKGNRFGFEDQKAVRILNKAILQALYPEETAKSKIFKLITGFSVFRDEAGAKTLGKIIQGMAVIMGQAQMLYNYTITDQSDQLTREITFKKSVQPKGTAQEKQLTLTQEEIAAAKREQFNHELEKITKGIQDGSMDIIAGVKTLLNFLTQLGVENFLDGSDSETSGQISKSVWGPILSLISLYQSKRIRTLEVMAEKTPREKVIDGLEKLIGLLSSKGIRIGGMDELPTIEGGNRESARDQEVVGKIQEPLDAKINELIEAVKGEKDPKKIISGLKELLDLETQTQEAVPDSMVESPKPEEAAVIPEPQSLEKDVPKQSLRVDEGNKVVGASLNVNGKSYLIGLDPASNVLKVYERGAKGEWLEVGRAEIGDESRDEIPMYLVVGEGTSEKKELLATYDKARGMLLTASEKTEEWTISDVKTGRGQQHQEVVVTYKYSVFGLLEYAHGSGVSQADDGFKNVTNSLIDQKYELYRGQAKMKVSETKSFTQNYDGSWSAMGWVVQGQNSGKPVGKAMTVEYQYNKEGELVSAFGSGQSIAANSDASITTSDIEQYFIILDSQAKLHHTKTTSKTKSSKSEQIQVLHVYYSYDRRNRLVRNGGAAGGGPKLIPVAKKDKDGNVLKDKFGNVVYEKDEEGNIVFDYERDEKGEIKIYKETFGEGTFVQVNIFRDEETKEIKKDLKVKTFGMIHQAYAIVLGQAKMVESVTLTNSFDETGPWSQKVATIKYIYDKSGRMGGAYGEERTLSGNWQTSSNDVTEQNSIQPYELINGQAKSTKITTRSTSKHFFRSITSLELEGMILNDVSGKLFNENLEKGTIESDSVSDSEVETVVLNSYDEAGNIRDVQGQTRSLTYSFFEDPVNKVNDDIYFVGEYMFEENGVTARGKRAELLASVEKSDSGEGMISARNAMAEAVLVKIAEAYGLTKLEIKDKTNFIKLMNSIIKREIKIPELMEKAKLTPKEFLSAIVYGINQARATLNVFTTEMFSMLFNLVGEALGSIADQLTGNLLFNFISLTGDLSGQDELIQLAGSIFQDMAQNPDKYMNPNDETGGIVLTGFVVDKTVEGAKLPEGFKTDSVIYWDSNGIGHINYDVLKSWKEREEKEKNDPNIKEEDKFKVRNAIEKTFLHENYEYAHSKEKMSKGEVVTTADLETWSRKAESKEEGGLGYYVEGVESNYDLTGVVAAVSSLKGLADWAPILKPLSNLNISSNFTIENVTDQGESANGARIGIDLSQAIARVGDFSDDLNGGYQLVGTRFIKYRYVEREVDDGNGGKKKEMVKEQVGEPIEFNDPLWDAAKGEFKRELPEGWGMTDAAKARGENKNENDFKKDEKTLPDGSVVRYIRYGSGKDATFMILEFRPGGNLKDRLTKSRSSIGLDLKGADQGGRTDVRSKSEISLGSSYLYDRDPNNPNEDPATQIVLKADSQAVKDALIEKNSGVYYKDTNNVEHRLFTKPSKFDFARFNIASNFDKYDKDYEVGSTAPIGYTPALSAQSKTSFTSEEIAAFIQAYNIYKIDNPSADNLPANFGSAPSTDIAAFIKNHSILTSFDYAAVFGTKYLKDPHYLKYTPDSNFWYFKNRPIFKAGDTAYSQGLGYNHEVKIKKIGALNGKDVIATEKTSYGFRDPSREAIQWKTYTPNFSSADITGLKSLIGQYWDPDKKVFSASATRTVGQQTKPNMLVTKIFYDPASQKFVPFQYRSADGTGTNDSTSAMYFNVQTGKATTYQYRRFDGTETNEATTAKAYRFTIVSGSSIDEVTTFMRYHTASGEPTNEASSNGVANIESTALTNLANDANESLPVNNAANIEVRFGQSSDTPPQDTILNLAEFTVTKRYYNTATHEFTDSPYKLERDFKNSKAGTDTSSMYTDRNENGIQDPDELNNIANHENSAVTAGIRQYVNTVKGNGQTTLFQFRFADEKSLKIIYREQNLGSIPQSVLDRANTDVAKFYNSKKKAITVYQFRYLVDADGKKAGDDYTGTDPISPQDLGKKFVANDGVSYFNPLKTADDGFSIYQWRSKENGDQEWSAEYHNPLDIVDSTASNDRDRFKQTDNKYYHRDASNKFFYTDKLYRLAKVENAGTPSEKTVYDYADLSDFTLVSGTTYRDKDNNQWTKNADGTFSDSNGKKWELNTSLEAHKHVENIKNEENKSNDVSAYAGMKDTTEVVSASKMERIGLGSNEGRISRYDTNKYLEAPGTNNWKTSFAFFTKDIADPNSLVKVFSGYKKNDQGVMEPVITVVKGSSENPVKATVRVNDSGDIFTRILSDEDSRDDILTGSGSAINYAVWDKGREVGKFQFVKNGDGTFTINTGDSNSFFAHIANIGGEIKAGGTSKDDSNAYNEGKSGFSGGMFVSSLKGFFDMGALLKVAGIGFGAQAKLYAEKLFSAAGLAMSKVSKLFSGLETKFEIMPESDVKIIPETAPKTAVPSTSQELLAQIANFPGLEGIDLSKVSLVSQTNGSVKIIYKEGATEVRGTILPPAKEKNTDGTSTTAWRLNIDRSETPVAGFGTSTHQEMTTIYEYDKQGYLIGAKAKGWSVTNDGFGNVTYNKDITNEFKIIRGQARLWKAITPSYTVNMDGSMSWQDGSVHNGIKTQSAILAYELDPQTGLLRGNGANASLGVSITNDGFDNWTKTEIQQTYKLINGQAKLSSSRTVSNTTNLDLSTSYQDLTVDYKYFGEEDEKGIIAYPVVRGKHRLGQMAHAEGRGTFNSNDGFGNISEGTLDQEFTNPWESGGQAKLLTSTSKSHTTNVDGSESWQDGSEHNGVTTEASVITYRYDEKGHLNGEGATASEGITVNDDGFGNYTVSRVNQIYTLINGQAKLKDTVTRSLTRNADGSWSVMGWKDLDNKSADRSKGMHGGEEMRVTYYYFGEDRSNSKGNNYKTQVDRALKRYLGTVAAAEGNGLSYSNDGFDNKTYAFITQSYEVFNGQAKMIRNETRTRTENIDGSRSWQGWKETAESNAVYNGIQTQASVIHYLYNKNGVLINEGARADKSVMMSDDGFGNWTKSEVDQTYVLINGQAKLKRSISNTDSFTSYDSKKEKGWNADGSSSHQVMTVSYTYKGEGITDQVALKALADQKVLGQLASADGKGTTLSEDGFGNWTAGIIEQTYEIIKGQAKIMSSNSKSWSSNSSGAGSYKYNLKNNSWAFEPASGGNYERPSRNDDDSWSRQDMTTYYAYDSNGSAVLTGGVFGGAPVIGEDGKPIMVNGKVKRDGRTYGRGTSLNDDGFGNISDGTVDQVYRMIKGQAKLASSKSVSVAKHYETVDGAEVLQAGSSDGSTNSQEMWTKYDYDADGKQTGQSGRGNTVSDDGFGNYTAGIIEQVYALVGEANKGQSWKVFNSTSKSWSSSSSGAGSWNIDGDNNWVFTASANGGSYDGNGVTASDATWSKQEMVTTYIERWI
ncbi:MAG: hypothetical protein HYT97_05960 [Elusimicrobia bacterium]|nr:hypothetical protein [Elusimicrobiota bacterium]